VRDGEETRHLQVVPSERYEFVQVCAIVQVDPVVNLLSKVPSLWTPLYLRWLSAIADEPPLSLPDALPVVLEAFAREGYQPFSASAASPREVDQHLATVPDHDSGHPDRSSPPA